MTSSALNVAALLLCVSPNFAQAVVAAAEPPEPGGLATVFEPGLALADQNGDGQTDALAARIVLPDDPRSGDVAAAVAVASRLGFETSGMDLPLVFHAAAAGDLRGVPLSVVVGTSNPRLPRDIADRAKALEKGQGLVTMRGTTVYIAGVDDSGTQAAGEAFAARSPYLWRVIGRDEGETFDRIQRDLFGVLGEVGVVPTLVTVDELVYQKDIPEAVHVEVRVEVPVAAQERSRQRLRDLVQEHRRGSRTDRLSYGSAGQVLVRIGDQESVSLPRVGLPGSIINPPRQRPTRFPRPRGGQGRGARGGGSAARGRRFDLSQVYTISGLLQDGDGDRIPDNTNLMIVYPATADESPAAGTAEFAARLGLESTGLTLPIFGFDKELADITAESRPLVMVGNENKFVRELRQIGKLREEPPAAGIGRVEMVPDAWRGNSSVVIHGGDRAGEEAAAEYLAGHLPKVWALGLGDKSLDDVAEAARKLLAGRSTPAQVALAYSEVEKILLEIGDDAELESLSVESFFDQAVPEFDQWLLGELQRRYDGVEIKVQSKRRFDPVQVFEQKPELEWEVDAFWSVFREKVLANVQAGQEVAVELRVSEAPELRSELADQIRAAIEEKGGRPGEVLVLSAYKQGLSWLLDKIVPALEDKPVASFEVGFELFPVLRDTKQRFQNEPARWLNELYPADEMLADRLDLPLETFTFASSEDLDSTYTVVVRDATGATLLEDAFSPAIYKRPYFDAFPEYTEVTVATGWLKVSVAGESVVDERIHTDSDRIWDHFQGQTLDAVYDHVKKSSGGKPTRDKAPFFHTLRVDLQASEPDYKIGLDQEHISVLESLHDDIYFDSLDFFNEVARVASGDGAQGGGRSLAAGNILPWIHPERRGQAPSLTVTYSSFASKEPKVVVKYKVKPTEEEVAKKQAEKTEAKVEQQTATEKEPPKDDSEQDGTKTVTRTIKPVSVTKPYTWLAELRAGSAQVARLGFLVELEDDANLIRLANTLDQLARLQKAGLFPHALGHEGVEAITLRLEAPGALTSRTFASRPAAKPVRTPVAYRTGPIVTWDHVISPDESERISHTLGTLPNVNTFVAGRSYQGREISVMEVRLPMSSALVSQAKLNSWKPVLNIVGRQHANEVSSTSHMLRLVELLATDPKYQPFLNRMNLVVQPVVNPDGAALAYELQKITPTHCLHAGRYSALGPDIGGRGTSDQDTLLTEGLVMTRVSNRWVADVSLNPHGYPSHEWVHQFGNYNPKSFRSYWIPRGWYTSARPSEDPRLEDFRDVTLAMMDYIDQEVSRDEEIKETNRRIYDRYDRWAIRWQPHLYNLDIHGDTAIYSKRRGGGVSVANPNSMLRATVFSGGTEAMDETAQGEWLDLVTRMGFGYLMASVRFLDDAEYQLYRMEGETGGGVRLAKTRPRPIRPGSPNKAQPTRGRKTPR